ncbi:MAG: hypothetical protein ACJ72E_06775 [Marmoricola sp.]
MNDDDLRLADPYDALRGADLGGADLALLEDVLAAPDADLDTWRSRRRPSLRSGLVRAGLAAAAVTAAVAVPVVIDHGHGSSPSQHSPQTTRIRYAAMVKVAQENPRIVLDLAGWKVRDLEGFDPETGGMRWQLGPDRWRDVSYTPTDGNAMTSAHVNLAPQVEVSWYPSDQYESYLADRAAEPHVQQVQVLGLESQMVSYSATDHAVMLPPQGKVFIEIRSSSGDEAAFKKLLAHGIEQVDVDTWLAALPDAVVTPGNAAQIAARMLEGMALPPGFDRGSLVGDVPMDQYQFGAKVSGAVACGWLEDWTRAHAAGDTTAEQQAVQALAGSHGWNVLQTMKSDGDYPAVLWEYADKIAEGQDPAGYRSGLGCP